MQSIDNIYKYLGKGSETIFHFLFITHLIFSNYCYIFLAVFMPSEVMHSFVYGQYFLSLTGCLVNEDPATVVCNVWVSAQYMQDICFAASFFWIQKWGWLFHKLLQALETLFSTNPMLMVFDIGVPLQKKRK